MSVRRYVVSPLLAIGMVIGLSGTAAAAVEYAPDCPNGFVASGNKCSLTSTTINLTSSKPYVYLSGYIRLTNDNRPSGINSTRTELRSTLYCYDSAGKKVFAQGAVRNIWPGIGSVTVNVKGVLHQDTPGQYRCDMVAWQGPAGTMGTASYYLSGSLDTPIYKKYGDGTFGPNSEGFPDWDPTEGLPGPDARTLVSAHTSVTPVAQLDWSGIPGEVTATLGISMTNITTCSFSSDAPPCPAPAIGTATIKVIQTMWQTSAGSTAPCPVAPSASYSTALISLNDTVHHATYPITGTVSLSSDPLCGRRVIMQTTVDNQGSLDVYVSSTNTAISVTN